MSASPILTQGLGGYGAATLLPTLGFSATAIAPSDAAGVEFTAGNWHPHYTAARKIPHYTSGDWLPQYTSEEY